MAGFSDSLNSFAAIAARDLVKDWPLGANKSDTMIGGRHFNLTALQYWNYTYYSNETVSNGSKCYLMFPPYQPVYLFGNGTFTNNTSCYTAIDPIGARGVAGIGFASAYGFCIMLLLVALAKHGKTYLPRESRFFPIGRRWQWYWGLFVCACAIAGLFMNIDIDRYFLQELPITVTVFFWYLLCMGTVALTWEAVRHWGSWLERQFIDPNPFVYQQDDKRATMEFWMPMFFYFWVWMNFFLVIPRSWTFPQKQRSPEQTAAIAEPTANGARFKAAAFCLVVAWATILFSLRHSIKHYKDQHRGIINRTVGFTKAVPFRFYLIIPLTAVLIAYQAFIAWNWEYSLVRIDAPIYVIFTWGYTPSLLIIIVQVLYGFASPNEDKDLVRQRRERGDRIDQELGIVKKPAWWRRVRGEHLMSFRDKLVAQVNEVGGTKGTGRRDLNEAERHAREEALAAARNEDDIEMYPYGGPASTSNPRVDRAGVSTLQRTAAAAPEYRPTPYQGKSDQRRHERTLQAAAGLIFPNDLHTERARRHEELGQDGPAPPPYTDDPRGRTNSRAGYTGRSNSAETTNSITAPPQNIKSMLDV